MTIPGDVVVAPMMRRLVLGGSFALDVSPEMAAVVGQGDDVLWAKGETLFIVGPVGVGKTACAQRLTLGRIGIGPKEFLGLPIEQDGRAALYIAADRPRQAQRSIHRMVREEDRRHLDEHLLCWWGPLEFDVAAEPERFAEWCASLEVGTVVVDSLKDVAVDLVKDETGCRVNRALQLLVASDVEVLVLHHQRKSQAENRKPKMIADVYGSSWITAGAGSVPCYGGTQATRSSSSLT